MSTIVGDRRWVTDRITAHRMHASGASKGAIAEHLGVCKRSVSRYLNLPCPDRPVTDSDEVDLASFYLAGACGHFPELNWASRSLLMQTEVKEVCRHCPVLAQCRSYGLTKGRHDVGVWGAMTMAERQREIRKRAQGGGSRRRPGRVVA